MAGQGESAEPMESEYHIAPQPVRGDAAALRQPRAAAKPDARIKPERAPSATRERGGHAATDPTCKNCLVPVKLCHCSASRAPRGCARCLELEQELGAERRAAQLDSQSRTLEQEAHAATFNHPSPNPSTDRQADG